MWFWLLSISVFFAILSIEFYFKFISNLTTTLNYAFIVFFLYFIFQSAFMILKIFEENDVKFNENYFFWISFSRLFYFLTILFIFIYPTFVDGFSNRTLYSLAFISINTVGNILMNILYTISFVCKKSRI